MKLETGLITNSDVRLEYLAAGARGRPLLVCPGLSDSAIDYRGVLERLSPLRCVAMSFRGQGGSDAPSSGYDLADFCSDIAAVIGALELERVVIFAHSRAVSYAVAYAAAHPDMVEALVVGDAPPVHRSYPPEWVEHFAASEWRGQRVDERIPKDVLARIQQEATHVDLWDTFATLDVRRLAVLGGSHPHEFLSPLAERYDAAGAEVVVFEGSGHALWDPDLERLVRLLRRVVDDSS